MLREWICTEHITAVCFFSVKADGASNKQYD
jgi:hypothetical protein